MLLYLEINGGQLIEWDDPFDAAPELRHVQLLPSLTSKLASIFPRPLCRNLANALRLRT